MSRTAFIASAFAAAMTMAADMGVVEVIERDMERSPDPPARSQRSTSRKGVGLSPRERAWREKERARNRNALASKD